MIQRRQQAGLVLEPRHTFRIARECLVKKFDGDTAAQLRVRRLIHVAHTTRAEVTDDLVLSEFRADHDEKENLRAKSIK